MLMQRWLATRNINNFKAAASEFTLTLHTASYHDASIQNHLPTGDLP